MYEIFLYIHLTTLIMLFLAFVYIIQNYELKSKSQSNKKVLKKKDSSEDVEKAKSEGSKDEDKDVMELGNELLDKFKEVRS